MFARYNLVILLISKFPERSIELNGRDPNYQPIDSTDGISSRQRLAVAVIVPGASTRALAVPSIVVSKRTAEEVLHLRQLPKLRWRRNNVHMMIARIYHMLLLSLHISAIQKVT